jgi:hypothetical protein
MNKQTHTHIYITYMYSKSQKDRKKYITVLVLFYLFWGLLYPNFWGASWPCGFPGELREDLLTHHRERPPGKEESFVC